MPDIVLPSVGISDETPYLVFDILLLNVWLSSETFHPLFIHYFSVFGYQMKHSLSCLMYQLKNFLTFLISVV